MDHGVHMVHVLGGGAYIIFGTRRIEDGWGAGGQALAVHKLQL